MKQFHKRVVPLILAAIILLSTLTGLFALSVSAAEDDDATIGTSTGTIFNTSYVVHSGPNSSSIVRRITRNRSVAIELEFLKTGVVLTDPDQITVNMAVGSFVPESGAQYEVTKVERDPNTIATRITVMLSGIKYSGKGNTIDLLLQYPGSNLDPDTAQVHILECEEYVDDSSSDDEDDEEIEYILADLPTPFIIIDEYDYGGGQVSAGSSFNLNLSFVNTSRYIDIENIVMTLKTSEDLSITSSSNTFYIEELAKGQAASQQVRIQAKPSATPGSPVITISFKYEYVTTKETKTAITDERKSVETTEEIAIPVYQVDRFQIDTPQYPTNVMQGEEFSVTVSYVNKGRTEIYNVSAEIHGFNAQEPMQHLGNLTQGEDGDVEFYITADSVGAQSGELVISYEDANMNIKEISIPVQVTVEEMVQDTYPGMIDDIPTDGSEVEPEQGLPVWAIWAMIGGGIVVLIVAVKVVKRIREKKLEAEDEII